MNETIMIVDDSTFIVDGLVAILKRKGYKPVPALSGDECLELLKTSTPDLILLDIMMEPMDGWQTLTLIKNTPAKKDIPVFMVTGKAITDGEAQKYRGQFKIYLMKPVTPKQLKEAIEGYLKSP